MITIDRITEEDKRYYVTERDGRKIKAPNVTSFIDLFTDKSWLERWYMSLGRQNLGDEAHFCTDEEIYNEGKQHAQAHTNRASTAGTNSHNLMEDFILQGRTITQDDWINTYHLSPNLYSFFKHVRELHVNNTPSVELKLIYEHDEYFSIGGTTDLVAEIDYGQFTYHPNEKKNNNLRNLGQSVVDYKFPNKPKYKKDIINYCLQLAIYKYGLNQTYKECKIVDGLIVVSPRSTEMLYLYYLNPTKIDYYFKEAQEMFYLYRHGLTEVYEWLDFVKQCEKDDMLPDRLCLTS